MSNWPTTETARQTVETQLLILFKWIGEASASEIAWHLNCFGAQMTQLATNWVRSIDPVTRLYRCEYDLNGIVHQEYIRLVNDGHRDYRGRVRQYLNLMHPLTEEG